MARMSEINVNKSKFFKIPDLEKMAGEPWGKAEAHVTIVKAEIGEYPAQEGAPPEDAYLIEFLEHEKPLGCNLTNRKTLASIVGDVEWDTKSLAGTKLILFGFHTEMGPGIRLRFDGDATANPETDSAEAATPF